MIKSKKTALLNTHVLYFVFSLGLLFSCNKEAHKYGEHQAVNAPFPFAITPFISIKNNAYSIAEEGAVADGLTDNASVINRVIEQCHEAGGGVVNITAGTWFTSGIRLRSNVCLNIEEGAELLFSDNPNDYLPVVFTRWEGLECYNYAPLIYAQGCENVAITGKGKINGNGANWWQWKNHQKQTLQKLYSQSIENTPVQSRVYATKDTFSYLRPSLIQFINCKNVVVNDITIGSGPMWTVHFVYCENVIAQRLQVITKGTNNDGIIPESCKNVLIEDCFFSTGDDCIVIKSGLNEEAWRIGRPSENIVVRRCTTEKGHGGIVMGSEMSGGIRNVFVDSCTFKHTHRGIRLKSMPGRGGYIQNIHCSNIVMDSIPKEGIVFDGNYASSSIPPQGDSLPYFRDIFIKNITCSHANIPILIDGINKNVQNIVLKNISMHGSKSGTIREVSGLLIENVQLQVPGVDSVLLVNDCENTVWK